ncbi:hypothetical protein IGA85_33345, partial [Pseudomonas aeruginosa]|nr:hypothetical protein [Pseudomonas aeruginosa]
AQPDHYDEHHEHLQCSPARQLETLLQGLYQVDAGKSDERQRRYALQAHQDTLRGMMRQLEDLVATDELTGLFNRRHFMRL